MSETTREVATRVADSSILRDDLIDEIEQALNAERERAAKILERYNEDTPHKHIAAAIRGSKQ